ncbi:MAG: DNA pilot protein [Microviridae sp.]|nr:MAG: DNA pilot protein [Microviridae sp.]
MPFPILAAVGEGLAAAAPVVGAGLNMVANNQSNQANADIAAKNNATAIELANTQYSRGKADMERAGLNPALMYGNAGPAPTPQLTSATMRPPDFSQGASGLASSLMQVQALAQSQQTIDNGFLEQVERIAKIRAEMANLPTATGMVELNKQLAAAELKLKEFNSRPNDLGQLSTKLLSRLVEYLEKKYNSNTSPQGRSGYMKDFMELFRSTNSSSK